jgi:hypothetical protein
MAILGLDNCQIFRKYLGIQPPVRYAVPDGLQILTQCQSLSSDNAAAASHVLILTSVQTIWCRLVCSLRGFKEKASHPSHPSRLCVGPPVP